jgi:hypothetical protein
MKDGGCDTCSEAKTGVKEAQSSRIQQQKKKEIETEMRDALKRHTHMVGGSTKRKGRGENCGRDKKGRERERVFAEGYGWACDGPTHRGGWD